MNISSEMLAAYAEGKVSGAERDAIRKYLAENPSELKSVVMMMDEDYDLDLDVKNDNDINFDDKLDFPIGAAGGMAGCFATPSLFTSAADFMSKMTPKLRRTSENKQTGREPFSQRLDKLLDSL